MHDRPAPRRLLRLALRIQDQLAVRQPSPLTLPRDTWDELCAICDRLRLAQERHWKAAAQPLMRDLEYTKGALIRRLQSQLPTDDLLRQNTSVAPLREIFADLQALYDEFSEVRIEWETNRLIVVTDEICLEGIHLGRFEIVLHWPLLSKSQDYDVVAETPSAAASDSSTTHPHVRDESLCEGEGQEPIRKALRQGRLLDFFILVRQILETYNPSSAFIKLSYWYGKHCHDCGSLTGEDESMFCDRCETDLCCDCSSLCFDCGMTCCSDCCSFCADCKQVACNACLNVCTDCDKNCCTNCLTEDRCRSCHEIHLEDETDERPTESVSSQPTTQTNAPLQPLGLVQTSVLT